MDIPIWKELGNPPEEDNRGRLVEMCLRVACQSKRSVDSWRRQRRTIERMPALLAEPLFHQLYHNHLLSPPLLELFQYSVEEVNLSGDPGVDAEWLAYLGGFRYLRALKLADCKSLNNGAVWPLSGLKNLEELELSRCAKITDGGLEHLLCLSSLKKLGLSETGIGPTGVAKLARLQNLTSLDLGGLPISDDQLASLQVLSQLTHLDLWGTKISDNGACHLQAFHNLRTLNLSWTNITMVPPLPVVSLSLSNCTIISIYEGFDQQPASLTQLDLSRSVIPDPSRALGIIANKLLSLDLSAAKLPSFSILSGFYHLQKLNLSYTGVTDATLSILTEYSQDLRYLDLGHTKVGADGVAVLAGHGSKLEFISLTATIVDDSVFPYLELMPLLGTIDLSYTKVKGVNVGQGRKHWSMSSLEKLCYLRCLDLSRTEITDKSCRWLASLKQLSHLFLRSDFMSDAAFHSLSGLPKLVTLHFQGCVLTDSGLTGFKPPAFLEELDITDCWLLSKASLVQFSEKNPQIFLRHELLDSCSETGRFKGANLLWYKTGSNNIQDKINSRNVQSHVLHSSRSGRTSIRKVRDVKQSPVGSHINIPIMKGRDINTFADERRKYSLSELLSLQSAKASNQDLVELPEMIRK